MTSSLPPPNHRAAPERPQASGGGAASFDLRGRPAEPAAVCVREGDQLTLINALRLDDAGLAQLERLASLKASGMLTDEEFSAAKKALLGL